jgi:hypothetical protein
MFSLALGLISSVFAATPSASSELRESSGARHPAAMAFDGALQTGWAEAQADAGAGAWLELRLDRATPISSVSIWPGDLSRGSRSLREAGRPKYLTVTLTTASGPVTAQARVPDLTQGPARVDVAIEGNATAVRVTVDEALDGVVRNDTYIAEIALNFAAGEVPDAVDKARAWLSTPAATAAEEKNKLAIVKLFDAIKAAEFGDADKLAKIMDQAAEGAPYVRDRAQALPLGFRVHATPPGDTAIEALKKLKDPNAIAALELAALRVNGREARELSDLVQYFEAYQEWIGGPNLNLGNWGSSGWQQGALRSFGEPLAVSVDTYGDLFVVDTANHRVQRFDPNGKANRVWGKAWAAEEPPITSAWFDKARKFYVSGAKPSDEAGAFRNPVDVAVLPGKTGTGLAVLDARGRITVFDPAGAPVGTWKVGTEYRLTAGVGGEGYLDVVGNQLVAVFGEEAFVYTLAGEEKGRFPIKDGTPKGLVALKGGKLGMIFEDQLVMYSLDGFRHGGVLRDDDARGEGYEDWDVANDEKGMLWALTDTGRAVKYKKPGKVEYSIDLGGPSLKAPRFAVYADVLFIVEGDRIRRVDALEIKAKAELAGAEAP